MTAEMMLPCRKYYSGRAALGDCSGKLHVEEKKYLKKELRGGDPSSLALCSSTR